MSYDYYVAARHLAVLLKDEELDEWEFKICGAMEEGVTATEILMMLRWTLDTFLSTKLGSPGVRGYAKKLYQEIDTVLK